MRISRQKPSVLVSGHRRVQPSGISLTNHVTGHAIQWCLILYCLQTHKPDADSQLGQRQRRCPNCGSESGDNWLLTGIGTLSVLTDVTGLSCPVRDTPAHQPVWLALMENQHGHSFPGQPPGTRRERHDGKTSPRPPAAPRGTAPGHTATVSCSGKTIQAGSSKEKCPFIRGAITQPLIELRL